MSKIAEALAKAKERTGTTIAPFLTPGPAAASLPPPVDPAKVQLLRKAQNTQRFWIALLPVAFLCTAVAIWSQLKSAPDAPPVSAAATPPASATPLPSAAPAPSNPAPTPKTPPAEVAAAPNAELYHAVNALVITAVLPGERPRLMYRGRIVAVGEVVEGELVFAGVREGNIVLNDRRGAAYTRRY